MPVRNFALVSFTNSDSVGIVETKTIATDRDRTRLNSEEERTNQRALLSERQIGKLCSVVVLSSWLL